MKNSNEDNPYNNALTITKSSFFERVKSIFSKSIDHTEKLDLVEEILLTSDVGVQTTNIVLNHLQQVLKLSLIHISEPTRPERSGVGGLGV